MLEHENVVMTHGGDADIRIGPIFEGFRCGQVDHREFKIAEHLIKPDVLVGDMNAGEGFIELIEVCSLDQRGHVL